VKHASAECLARLDHLLARLRAFPELVERKPGIFYLRGSAYLHFHEDPAGLFADVKLDRIDFVRFDVTAPTAQGRLLTAVQRSLASMPAPVRRTGTRNRPV
jgi:hypothetical protein